MAPISGVLDGGFRLSADRPWAPAWTRVPISRVEDLSDAVLGAGLEVTQLSRAPVTGSLAFSICDGITFGTGYIGGQVALTGTLSQDMITLGLGLVLTQGSRQWLNEVATGNVGLFLPGDDHDALYMAGSLYATATLSAEHLEEIAAQFGLVLDGKTLGGSGVDSQKLINQRLAALRARFAGVHARRAHGLSPISLGKELLQAFIMHLGRVPRPQIGRMSPHGYGRIVSRARAFIRENLDQPLSIEKIAAAAITSHRTLHRAFRVVLNETPYSYVIKLRLHRVRHELISNAEMTRTITCMANQWGVGELGRFDGWYHELFGEQPSYTRARYRHVGIFERVWQDSHRRAHSKVHTLTAKA